MLINVFRATAKLASFTVISGPKLFTNTVGYQKLVPVISAKSFSSLLSPNLSNKPLLVNLILPQTTSESARNVTKFSIRKGKRKSVKAVLKRFYRLNWGIWIRTKCGRAKRLWRKSPPRKRRLRQHVFCNATQSTLLDKMVGRFWTRPKYYVDDPYEPYHTRDEWAFASKKPRPYIAPEDR